MGLEEKLRTSFSLLFCFHTRRRHTGCAQGGCPTPQGLFVKPFISLLISSPRLRSEHLVLGPGKHLPSLHHHPLTGSSFPLSQLLQDAPQAPRTMEARQDGTSCLSPLSSEVTHRALQFGDSPTSHLLFKLPQELLKSRYFSFSFSAILSFPIHCLLSQGCLIP